MLAGTPFVALAALVTACGEQAQTPAKATLAPFGVASVATMVGGPLEAYEREAAAIRNVNAEWIRVVLQWHKLESLRGVFDWSTGDNAIGAAASYGLQILVCISGPAPLWAQVEGADPKANGNPPADPAAFGAIVALIAQRYGPAVKAWEIWNEPNVPEYFAPVDVGHYASLLRAAHRSIHAVQPDAVVMSGGLSSAPYGVKSVDFVRRLYQLGAAEVMDAVALHPYTYPFPITADPERRAEAVPQVREIMSSYGQQAKQIWLTEFGQATGKSPQAVSASRQSEILVDFLTRVSALAYLGPAFLFTTRDLADDLWNQHYNYGLYAQDYRPKPVVEALRRLTTN